MDGTLVMLHDKLNKNREPGTQTRFWQERRRGRDPRPKNLTRTKQSGWVIIKSLFVEYQNAVRTTTNYFDFVRILYHKLTSVVLRPNK
jgi:hypothetical protein